MERLHQLHKDREATIVDVRLGPEWTSGHIPGSTHLAIGAIPSHLGDIPQTTDGRIVTMCAGGTRATLAASLLKGVGYDPLVVASGGFHEWASHDWPAEHGS